MTERTERPVVPDESELRGVRRRKRASQTNEVSDFDRSIAVIVGIDKYEHVPQLKTAVNDATKLADTLRDDHNYDVILLTDEWATLEMINRVLQTLPTKMQQDDRLLFYFAGHGIAEEGDDGPTGYLIPQDAQIDDESTLLEMTRFHDALMELQCKHSLIILDCCFAGALRWSTTRAIHTPPRKIYRERYNRFIQYPAWQVLTSAADNQKALDAARGKLLHAERDVTNGDHSPFAEALFAALKGKADTFPPAQGNQQAGDGLLTATELYQYIQDVVGDYVKDKHHEQTPGMWPLKKHKQGEYVFNVPGRDLLLEDAPPLDKDDNPYRGLEAFEPHQHHLFFGRTALTKQLAKVVSDCPFTLVLGASGTGKSSLVKAGLMPVLRGDAPLNPDVGGSTDQTSNDDEVKTFDVEPQDWRVLDPMRPTASPLASLLQLLKDADIAIAPPQGSEEKASSLGSLQQRLIGRKSTVDDGQQILAKQLSRTIKQWCQNSDKKLLLVVDQFEEVITLCEDVDERRLFITLLVDILNDFPKQLRLVLTLRSDFERQIKVLFQASAKGASVKLDVEEENADDHAQPTSPVSQTKNEAAGSGIALKKFDVPPMSRDELREVIEGPASVKVIFFDPPKLVDTLIDDVAKTPGALPLLSFTLSQMYLKYFEDQSDTRALTDSYYQELGGVIGSLRKRADEEYERLGAECGEAYQKTMQRVMVRMVAVEGGVGTRRRILRRELEYSDQAETDRADEVIRRLIAARLLASGGNDGESYLEPAHDALVTAWDNLREWVGDVREHLPLQRRLAIAADSWYEASQRRVKQGLLWHNHPWLPQIIELLAQVDPRLIKMGRWARVWRSARGIFSWTTAQGVDEYWLNGRELDFVQRSVTRKRRRRLWGYAVGFAIYTVLSTLLLVTCNSLNEAETQAAITRVGQIAAQSQAAPAGQTSQSLLLALEAITRANSIDVLLAEPAQALHEAVERPLGYPLPDLSLADITASNVSADGNWGVVGTEKGEVRIYNSLKDELIDVTAHTEWINVARFSPDSLWLVTGSDDSEAHLWSLQELDTDPSGAEPWVLPHNDWVIDAAFSPDGLWLVTVSDDGTAWEWSLENPDAEPELLLDDDELPIYQVTFRADGTRVIAGFEDDWVWVWPEDETAPWEGSIDTDIGLMTLDPNGQWLLVADDGDEVMLRSLDNLDAEPHYLSLKDNATSTAFSRDGRLLATGSTDGTVWLWSLENPQLPLEVLGHGSPIRSVAFGDEGSLLMTSGDDGLTRIWIPDNPEIAPTVLSGHDDWVWDLDYSATGEHLVSASEDGTVQLWSTEADSVSIVSQESQVVVENENWVTGVAFGPDGSLYFASTDGVIHKRDAAHGGNDSPSHNDGVSDPILQEQGVSSFELSPDRQWLVIGSTAGTTSLWTTDSLERVETLPGPEEQIWDVAFSPDSRWLAAGYSDGTVQVWDMTDLAAGAPHSHAFDNWVGALAFSHDGRYLAVGLGNGTIDLRAVADDETMFTQIDSQQGGSEQPIRTLLFSPNGMWLFSGGEDNTAKKWQIDNSGLERQIADDPIVFPHEKNVIAMALSPDEHFLATGSAGEGKVQLWPINPADLMATACTFAGRNLTLDEWNNYFPGETYRRTCLEWPVHPSAEASQASASE